MMLTNITPSRSSPPPHLTSSSDVALTIPSFHVAVPYFYPTLYPLECVPGCLLAAAACNPLDADPTGYGGGYHPVAKW